ncbi:MAG: OmpH family outer membrane protein [Acidobacteriaceae bacterium]|nr:OmpH family outer membrane protein [Acidobacteriaceae bacterium]
MNRNVAFASALAAVLTAATAVAQTTSAPAPAPAPAETAPAAQAPVPPQAIPAKIAIIEYEQVTAATNEGQRALQDIQKKYEPKKTALETMSKEIDSLQKQLQASGSTLSDDERSKRMRDIDTKQKQLQRDSEDANNAFQADMQDALSKIAQKLGPVVIKYVQQNGFTMLLDYSGQQGGLSVMWAPGADISQAVVDAYNAASGVAAPVPSAPSAAQPAHPATAPKK